MSNILSYYLTKHKFDHPKSIFQPET